MKFFPFLLLSLLLVSGWENDFDEARKKAGEEHKYILLNFSGSDWCIPCIKLHKEIFESKVFSDYADGNLVLVNADFPRLKKNKLSKEQEKKNDALAELYNKDGTFPLTLLVDAEGKVLKTWEGMPHTSAADFTSQLKAIVDAGHGN